MQQPFSPIKEESCIMGKNRLRVFPGMFLLLFAITWAVSTGVARELEKGTSTRDQSLMKTSGTPNMTILNINNFTSFMRADGQGNHDVTDQAGGRFPRGTAAALYEDGFVWGGKVYLDAAHTQPSSQLIRVGGQTYNQATRPGVIIGTGAGAVRTDPANARARIYRIRRDYYFMTVADLTTDAATLNLSPTEADVTAADRQAVKDQYDTDWNNWPVDLGAPYIERNGQPGYQAPPAFSDNFKPEDLIKGNYDEPGVAGADPNSPADQVIWTVYNDLDPSFTLGLYFSDPIGLEGQVTMWAYKRTDALGNLYFKKIRLINKGGVDIGGGVMGSFYVDSMYISQWSDPDLGEAGDDLCGCDTTLSLGYVYNGNPVDNTYKTFGIPPPAAGYDFLQGPMVPSPGDSAIFNMKRVYDKKNLPLTSFIFFSAGGTISDPLLGSQAGGSYQSTIKWHRMLRGLQPDESSIPERYYPFPPGYTPGKFPLAGNPVTATGFVDGLGTTYSFAPGDRRIILPSGPFNLAPGDTQEVVIGVVGGLGADRLSSVSVMKFNDTFVQNTFDALFVVPTPPPTPAAKYTELDGHVSFEWGSNTERVTATESATFNPGQYTFEGYNVYQMENNQTKDLTSAVRIATFDLISDPTVVLDLQFDGASGQILLKPVQFGTNSGVTRSYNFTQDYVKDIPRLHNGTQYTIAITAYTVSRTGYLPVSLESAPYFATVTPHGPNPGMAYGPNTGSALQVTHQGTADGGPVVTVVDPGATTGHTYEAYFTERAEIRNQNSDWVPSASLIRAYNPNRPDSVTGSSIDIAAVYGVSVGKLELRCLLNLESVDFDFVDGIRMSMPPGVTIVNVPGFTAGNGNIAPVWSGNTIAMGDTTHPYTGNGPFAGGEEWIIEVSGVTLPAAVEWKIFDDGYGEAPLDAEGTTTVQQIGTSSRMAKYWNLKDATTNVVKLQNQNVVSGLALFPPRDDILTNLGTGADPIVDGFQISMLDVGYAAPINFFDVSLTPGPGSTTELTSSSSTSTLDIQNYTIFAATITSRALDNFGAGTSEITQLEKDYELRFTGVFDTTVVGGQTRITVRSGGQLATIFSTTSGTAGLGTHPLNPNPGVAQPFLIRIPFEVWCTDDNRQVNLAFRDRAQTPTASPFYAWNPVNRMYAVIVNSAYNATTPTPPNDDATWVLVFYGTNTHLGDVVTVTYANPIQIGTEKFSFTTTPPTFSSASAKTDVSRVGVFPNPYYAFNPNEISRLARFVTFNGLPTNATLRIFNLAGQLVRTLIKEGDTQFLNWNLTNDDNFPVASGMYIVHVDMPDFGASKVLKIAIIQEAEIPTNF